jgi:hypothetical protein
MKPPVSISTRNNDSDPLRKRSFNPVRDVALMLHAFEVDHPGMKMSWHINAAIRHYLADLGYAKQLPKLQKLYPEEGAVGK